DDFDAVCVDSVRDQQVTCLVRSLERGAGAVVIASLRVSFHTDTTVLLSPRCDVARGVRRPTASVVLALLPLTPVVTGALGCRLARDPRLCRRARSSSAGAIAGVVEHLGRLGDFGGG